MIKKLTVVLVLSLSTIVGFAQEAQVGKAFYDTRVVNGQSVEMSNEGVMKFIIGHRFGTLNSGPYQLFGLDNSTIRLGFDYGIKKWLNVGIGRSSFEKTYDGFVKLRLLKQGQKSTHKPLTLVYYSNIAYRTLKPRPNDVPVYTVNNLFYTHQLLAARKLNDRLSVQLMPTLVHRNLIEDQKFKNDVLAMGAAFRYVVTKKFTISSEYYYVLPNQINPVFTNSLALGFNIETKGHVFQLQVGNSRGMTEKFFVTETLGEVSKGDLFFGFNITRDFKLKGRAY
ncbi:MAG: hypothetical protein ACJAUV_000542 [Flavobacteriales bacterium]|jgi:hypothetical protein